MAYQRLTEADLQGLRNQLEPPAGQPVSTKLRKKIEADHFARTWLGQDVQGVEERVAGMRRPVVPPQGGGPPITPPGPPVIPPRGRP